MDQLHMNHLVTHKIQVLGGLHYILLDLEEQNINGILKTSVLHFVF